MIRLTFLAFFVSLVLADQPYCKPCKEGFAKLGEFFIQEESLDRQIEVLTAFVCEENEESCSQGIKKWWPAMAR